MFALSAVLTSLLLLEVVPSALAALTRFGPGVERLDSLTRLGLREGRAAWVVPAAGVLHTLTTVALLVGIWHPVWGVAGAAAEALFFGWVLTRQVRFGDRGKALFAYGLFTSWSVLVLLVAAVRL
ncbi:hypothetical protein [Actinacidiphila acidipaludis]|uniref:MAPEG family protein n=1 Tax=Actinacidiphila acidipaludis TaxID=2873382 RepID=A0ABS7Q576_9ACTN|nr:hypothetical protein [Streptomyces acidipaludis]MBY8877864.1 hypothetical protein [Streptomyces acidipaludis]